MAKGFDGKRTKDRVENIRRAKDNWETFTANMSQARLWSKKTHVAIYPKSAY